MSSISRRRSAWLRVFAPAATLAAAAVAGCASGSDAVTSSIDPATSAPLTAPVTAAEVWEAAGSTVSTEASVDPSVRTRADGLVGDGVLPEGFTTVSATVISADGDVCTVCLWLADVADERSQGLKGVTDLGDAVGMAFVFDSPGDGAFVMIDTPTPLSIAWFDADGGFVSALDMEPCTESDSDLCTRFRPDGSYTVAVEMLQGELDAIGIGPGSSIELLAGTESATCAPTT